MGSAIGLPTNLVTLDGNTNGFWSKFLIPRNSVGNIFQPNILQTLLSGRKRREVGREVEISNLVSELNTNDRNYCTHHLGKCVGTDMEDQVMTRRVSSKFMVEEYYKKLGKEKRDKCNEEYKMCLMRQQ
eukprot:TRINITY_DN21236_c0_g1_i1.p1 TRINITY_DN21236_c0_g1~~TRINITY_DN21236_c0_g1_i1.p1  ORF type:complete len:129 (+),score=31.75 TRINITY_DN21236_c0_g1_i1:24-410(+)